VRVSKPWSYFGSVLLLVLPIALAAQGQQATKLDRDVQVALDLMDHKEFRKAGDLLETVIRSRPPRDPEVHIMLATCRLNLEEKDQAIQVCERALKLYPGSRRLDKFYVAVLRDTCTKSERKARLTRSLRLKPDSPVYMVGLSEVLLAEDPNRFEIEPLVRKAAAALPQDPEAHYLYGQWACLNDRPDLSIRELTKALELTPADNHQAAMQIYTYLGISYDHLHKTANAERAFRKAIIFNEELPSPDPGVLMHYAKFLQGEEREAEAQQLIDRILRAAPAFGIAHLERAKFLAEQEKMPEALAEGELALKYSDSDVKQQRAAHALLARACHALGRTEEAKLHEKWIETHWRP
jgi:tetratricopeptide (TPR) repeat protein